MGIGKGKLGIGEGEVGFFFLFSSIDYLLIFFFFCLFSGRESSFVCSVEAVIY